MGGQQYLGLLRLHVDSLSKELRLGQYRAYQVPGTRFAFTFRCAYLFPEQLQFVARDRA